MNKKGFTLVELLAVIVILAIILAIAIPGISGIIKSATKGAFESDAKMVLQQLRYEKLKDDNFDVTTITAGTISNLNLSNANYADLKVGIIDNEPYIVIIGKNKWADLKACGTMRSMSVVPASDITTCEDISTTPPVGNETKDVNMPVLATGMTPIKWNETTWVTTTSADTDWYNYTTTDKKWANARTADGSMWVWIPRYVYKISTGWHTNTAGTIDVQFSIGTDDTRGGTVTLTNTGSASDSNGTWTSHPAFTFGSMQLTGIWVAKFEASGASGAIDIKPDVTSLKYYTISQMFNEARSMETNDRYGWGTTGNGIDTHMTKNIEWGAAIYLSQSTYGKADEIWINCNGSTLTGHAGVSASDPYTSGCPNAYSTTNGVNASTTGNIYGIYDMSGNLTEYTAAYVDNGHANLTTYGANLTSANAEYKDVYAKGTTDTQDNNYTAAINKKGDAVYETSTSGTGSTSWYTDYSDMPYSPGPFFARGGRWDATTNAGGFSLSASSGDAFATHSFRVTVIVDDGL